MICSLVADGTEDRRPAREALKRFPRIRRKYSWNLLRVLQKIACKMESGLNAAG